MGAYGNTTTGGASAIRTFIKTATSAVQIFRAQRATSPPAITSWTATTTGTANVLAASVDRTGVLIVNKTNAEVWLRFDATIPVAGAAHSMYLAAGERWEVPEQWIDCAISICAAAAGGTVYITAGTDA